MSRSATVITLALLGGLLTFSGFASVRQNPERCRCLYVGGAKEYGRF